MIEHLGPDIIMVSFVKLQFVRLDRGHEAVAHGEVNRGVGSNWLKLTRTQDPHTVLNLIPVDTDLNSEFRIIPRYPGSVSRKKSTCTTRYFP
eukprot:SAG11_NODE_26350_length_346_cov_1.036437_1_plen_91_part_10